MKSTITVLLGLASVSQAASIPWTGMVKRDNTLVDKWEGESGEWNITVGMGGGDFLWGQLVPWDAIQTAAEHCGGLACDTEWDVDTVRIVRQGSYPEADTTMVMKADGTFPDEILPALIEVLKAASNQKFTVEHDKTYWQTVPCDQPGSNECTGPGAPEGPIDQYTCFKRYAVRAVNKVTGEDAHLNLEANPADDAKESNCEQFVGLAGAFAGVINPVFGAGVTALSIVCGSAGI